MTKKAIELLEKVESRKRQMDNNLKRVVKRMKMEENEEMYGGQDTYIDKMTKSDITSRYAAIESGFDNGKSETRRGTYMKFRKNKKKRGKW